MQVGDSCDELQLLKKPLSNRIQDSFDRFHWRLDGYRGTEIPGLLDDGDFPVVHAEDCIVGQGRKGPKLRPGMPCESLTREESVP